MTFVLQNASLQAGSLITPWQTFIKKIKLLLQEKLNSYLSGSYFRAVTQ